MTREAVYYNVMFVHIYSNVYDFVSQKTGNFICIAVWTSGLVTCILLKVFLSIYTKKNRSLDKNMIFLFLNYKPNLGIVHDFRLLSWCKWDFCCCGLLTDCRLVNQSVLLQGLISPNLTLENGTNRLSRIVRTNYQPVLFTIPEEWKSHLLGLLNVVCRTWCNNMNLPYLRTGTE